MSSKTRTNTTLFDGEALPPNNETTAPNIAADASEHFTRNTSSANTSAPRSKEVVDLPIACIFTSPLNPRKRFDEAALREFAADIATDGVFQPITVRPRTEKYPVDHPTYEIVMGERRVRASVLAGLPTVPAGPLRTLLEAVGNTQQDKDAYAVLAGTDADVLRGATAEALLRQELISRYEYGGSVAPKPDWFLGGTRQVTPSVALQVEAETGVLDTSEPSHLFACADCQTKDAGAFFVAADGYETYKSDSEGAWVCDLCQDKRLEEAANSLFCAGCKGPLTPGAFDEASAHWNEDDGPLRMSTGELALKGRVWCEQCGPHVGDDGEAPAPNSGEDPRPPNETSDNGADDTEPDVNNEAPLCGCGKPTCLGICGNKSPDDTPDDNLDDWAYPAPEGMDPAKIYAAIAKATLPDAEDSEGGKDA